MTFQHWLRKLLPRTRFSSGAPPMLLPSWWKRTLRAVVSRERQVISHRPQRGRPPRLEALECRLAPANWSGDLTSNTTWSNTQVQSIVGNVRVDPGVTLTVQAGTVVQFNYGTNLTIDGTLLAQGSSTQTIYFTSYRDNSPLSGSNNASNGDWGTIQFNDDSTGNVLTDTQVNYGGGNGMSAAITDNGAPLTLSNSVVSYSYTAGLRVTTASPTVNGDTFQNNNGAAVSIDLASDPAITAVSLSKNGINGVELDSGSLSGNESWNNPGIVYFMQGTVTVPLGDTLTVAAGQIVKVNYGDNNLVVNGTLNAQGTAANPIIFTSYRDDANGGNTDNDGSGTSNGSNGDWGSIQFSSSSTANMLNYVSVLYGGGHGEVASVIDTSAALTFNNGAIGNSYTAGLRVNQANPTLSGDTFKNSYGVAVGIDLDSDPAITGVSLSNNAINGVDLDSGSLSGNESWNNPGIVYFMQGTVTVPLGDTLTVAAGQIVKVNYGDNNLVVNGTLNAQGTSANPIIFTSYRDDGNGGNTDNDSTGTNTGSKGDWGSIQFSSGSTANVLTYVSVLYSGGHGEIAAVIDNGGTLTFNNGLIGSSYTAGLRISQANPTLQGDTFQNNSNAAISMDLVSQPTINAATNDIQTVTITGSPTGGSFTLSFGGQTTSAIAFNATAATVQADLQALSTIGSGNMTVAGSSGGPYVCTFTGSLAGAAQPLLIANGSGLTGGTPAVTVTGNFTNNGTNGLALDGGMIASNISWNNPSIVYQMNGSVTVPLGDTLTIAPGQIVKVNYGDINLVVDGTLNAQGTAANPIIFTSYRDDANGGNTDNDSTGTNTGGKGDWGSIQFSSGSTANVLNYVSVLYSGGHGEIAAVIDTSAALSFSNGLIGSSNTVGLRVQGSNPTVASDTFQNNNGAAISMDSESNPNITNPTYTGNGTNGVITDSSNTSGYITTNTTWSGTVNITQNMRVNPGVTLTIMPGTIVAFSANNDLGITVDGTINAAGTAGSPIIFTSSHDPVAGGSGPGAGQWKCVQFNSDSTGNVLDHVDIRYAGQDGSFPAAIIVRTNGLSLTNSTIESSARDGLRIQGSNPTVTGDSFLNNLSPAIGMDLASQPTISGSTLTNNNVNGVSLDGGTIYASMSWNNPSIVYQLTGNITVATGATLTIGAGQIIKASTNNNIGLYVNGTLKASGTASQPVIFTSDHDDSVGGDTNNDGSNSSPGPGQWNGIQFNSGSSGNVLDHIDIRYGGQNGSFLGEIFVQSAGLSLTNSIIESSYRDGLRIQGSNPTVTGDSFLNNLSPAISMDLASQPVINAATNYIQTVTITGSPTGGSFTLSLGGQTTTAIAYNASAATVQADLQALSTIGSGSITVAGGNGGPYVCTFTGTLTGVTEALMTANASGLTGGTPRVNVTGNLTNNYVNAVSVDGGTIEASMSWNNPSIVYQLSGNITVAARATLSFGACQIIKASTNNNIGLYVNGTLKASGTASQPVIFTSDHDDSVGGDTNNDGSNSSPGPGQWNGIQFNSGSSGNVLDHIDIRYGGQNGSFPGEIFVQSAGLSLTNSTIESSYRDGLRIQGSNPTITGDSFLNNLSPAISLDLASQPVISGPTLTNNYVNGVSLDGGTIYASMSWNNPSIVYQLTGNITVAAGATLSVGAGQVIKAATNNNIGLYVNGTLKASGTAGQPVIFTSDHDDSVGGDTNNDGSNSSPGPGQWNGIQFNSGSSGNVLDHIDIRYGGQNGSFLGEIFVEGAGLSLTNSIIESSYRDGLRIQGSNPTVTGDTFLNNLSPAISMDLSSNPVITGGSATNNNINAVVLDGGTLTGNAFWNSTSIVYWLSGNITVPQGVTLTVAPGQIVKVAGGNNSLIVDGTLSAQGTPSSPVVFTSYRDDSSGGNTENDSSGTSTGSRGDGGGIQFASTSTGSTLDTVQIGFAGGYGNTAAVVVNGASLSLTDSLIHDSYTHAVYGLDGATVSLASDVIVNNNGTGIRAESGSQITATNDTIDHNSRGASENAASLVLTNCLITNNSDSGVFKDGTGVVNVSYCDVYNPSASNGNYNSLADPTGTNGNISADPMYVNLATGDYHLQSGSPAINAGTDNRAPIDDFDWNYRTANPAFDIGAYEFGGTPREAKNSPSGKVADVVADEVLTFRTAMDTTSFSLSGGIVSFSGPNGAITATGFAWLDAYQLEVDFPTQAVAGAYPLVISGTIRDAGGHALGSNYTASFTIVPPRIVGQSPKDFVSAPVSSINFTFDRPMDTTSFSLSDIVSFTGPGGALTATGFSWLDAKTLQVTFASQSTLGAYSMVLGPNIMDIGGNLLDQNGNGIGGEVSADNYTASFTLANIFHVSGTISTNTTWGGLTIVDDNVTIASGVTVTIAAGTIVKFQDTKGITVNSGATLNSNGTLAQPVIMTSYHDDSVGGDTDQDSGIIGPQPGDWGQILNNGTANFNYTQVLYGSGNGNTGLTSGAIHNSGGIVTFSNSILSQAFYDGLDTVGGSVTISNSVFIGADRAVVSTFSGSMISIVNSTFDDNRIGVFAHAGGSLSVTNSIIYNSLQIGVDTDSGTQLVSYSDVFSTVAGSVNYSGMTDPTLTQGDISADPQFKGASAGNYRLGLHSPAIDAANGTVAPALDAAGDPRFTVPSSAHIGKPSANGAYPDMGAFEFVEGATSNIDLAVTGVSTTTTTALEGDTVTVEWTVQNTGTAVAAGGWHDAVYLSASPVLTPDAILLGTVLNTQNLGAGQSYSTPAQGTFTLPGVVPGNYYLLVRCNSDSAVFVGSNLANDVGASGTTVAVDLPALTLGTPVNGSLAATGASEVYKVTTTAGSDLDVTLTGASGSTNELYVSFGDVPTPQAFDARGVVTGSANQSVAIASTQAGTYYILVYGASLSSTESFTLTASTPGFTVTSVSPAQGSNTGQVTLSIYGAQFTTSSQPALVDSAGATIMPLNVYYGDSGLISATFDLTGHPAGQADVQVVNGTNVVAKLPQSFTIVAGMPGQLQASFDTPSAVRVARVVPITIHYTNTGGSDLLAPILQLESTSPIQLSFDSDMDSPSTSLSLVAVNPNAPAGFLPPGAQGTITVYAEATTDGQGSISLSQDTYPAGPIDWVQIEPEIRPAGISDAAWNPIFAQIQQDLGSTWSSYENALAKDATLFAGGEDDDGDDVSYNLQNVFQLEFDNAMAKVNPSASGKAFLSDSAHPLVGATITLQDRATNATYFAVTRTDGSYVFPMVAPGTYALQSTSFVLGSDINVTVASQGMTVPDLIFLPTGAVGGSVTGDPTGAPLANVAITAASASGAVYTTSTDNNGTFDLTGLPTGTYTLSAQNPLYTSGEIDGIAVVGGQQVRNLEFLLKNGATISGTLTGLPASVPAGAVISAMDANGITQGTAVPQSDGSYAIDSLPAGTYTVTAQVPGFVAVSTAGLVVGTGQEISAPSLALASAGSIQGTISLPANASFSDQPTVTVVSGSTTVALDPVNADGSFTVPDLAPGTYTVTATIPGYLTIVTQVTISAGQTTMLPLMASTGGTISGTVRDPNNNPVSGENVTLLDSLGNTTAAITDANGNYQFPILPPGTYNVFLGTADEPFGTAVAVTISANSLQGTANLTTPATFTVSGTVFASDGSAQGSRARISCSWTTAS